MSYQVLARKWRPRSFDALVGQEHVVRALRHALDQNRLHHAYLFTGTRGVGKTTLARILAKSLNCDSGISSNPCGVCPACTEIDSGRFVDLIEVDAATNTKVDEMRQLLENSVYAPSRGRFKVYVIDEVHMLSTSAFNAMLKTLEEPPEHIKFILATTDPQKIPVTVLSRCLQFNLKQVPVSAITSHLMHVLDEEHLLGDAAALKLIAASARGSMRDALSLLDQAIAYAGGKLTEDAIRTMLGAVDDSFLYSILDAVADGNAAAAIAAADAMEARNVSFDAALQDLGTLLHRVALAQEAPDALPGDTPHRERLVALAGRFDPEEVQLYYQVAIHGRQDLPLAPDEYAGFSMALLRMIAFRPTDPARETGATEDIAKGAGRGSQRSDPPATGREISSFSGDWPKLAKTLSVSGVAKQLAQQSELKSFDGETVILAVAHSASQLAEKQYQDKLGTALQRHFGRPVKLVVEIAPTVTDTAMDRAAAAIGQDAFVRDLVDHFDATVVSASIKPIE